MEKCLTRTGRPKSFKVEEALEIALRVFWEKGYEGASLSDLTEAMGINRPSLYATFGNKEELFKKALDRYADKMGFANQALQEPTAKAAVEKLLMGIADALTNPCNPRGCLAVNGALTCGDEAQSIKQALAARRQASQTALYERLQRAKDEGDLPQDSDPDALARYITTVSQGMAVQASGGASREALREVVAMSLRNIF